MASYMMKTFNYKNWERDAKRLATLTPNSEACSIWRDSLREELVAQGGSYMRADQILGDIEARELRNPTL